uniref:Uncharacterized protein n=1 Tax=Hucho hucho TaxID=62062 RepID=A0A4W5KLY2_9TELE
MRLSATTIQQWWRAYQSKQEDDYDPSIQEGAALCIQTAWRGYKERWRRREAALLLQREWRALLKRREWEGAALAIQTAWRCHMAREAYLRLCGTMVLLQAAGKGYLARQSFRQLKEQRLREKEQRLRERESPQQQQQLLQNGQTRLSPEEDDQPVKIMGLDLSTWEDRSYKERERSLQRLNSQEEKVKEGGGVEIGEGGVARAAESSGRAQSEPPPVSSTAATVVVRERTRTLDEPCQRTTRAKRESRRMRELEQAKFSLELLKVRATGSGGASSPSEERRWSAELAPATTPPLRSPQGLGTPDSQSSKGSFELLSMDDEILKERAPLADAEEPGSPLSSEVPPAPEVSLVSKEAPRVSVSDAASSPPDSQSQAKLEPAATSPPPPKIENYLPTFYVPSTDGSLVITHRLGDDSSQPLEADTTSTTIITKPLKSIKQRRESSRRPVVVVISMQKETPLDQEELGGAVVRLPPVEVRDGSAQTGESPSSPRPPVPAPVPPLDPAPVIPISGPTPVPAANQSVLEKLERLNEEKEERQRHLQQQNEREMMDQIRKQKEVLERQRHHFAQHERELLEKQRGEALVRIQQSRQGGPPQDRSAAPPQDRSATAATSTRPLRPSSLLIERAPALA